MKTKELLDKYSKILSGLLERKPSEIRFFSGQESGQLNHMKLKDILKRTKLSEIKEIEYFQPEKDAEGNETGQQLRMTRWNNWSEGTYYVTVGDDILSTFELYKLPHCCAILVSCKAYVAPKYRNMRVGTTMNNLRQDIGRQLGYSTLMCTDIEKNPHQRQLLATNGWKDVWEVNNKRTGNKVFVSMIYL